MSSIILPSRWTKQPFGQVYVDSNNPLTAGIVQLVVADAAHNPPIDRMRLRQFTQTSGTSSVAAFPPNRFGVYFSHDNPAGAVVTDAVHVSPITVTTNGKGSIAGIISVQSFANSQNLAITGAGTTFRRSMIGITTDPSMGSFGFVSVGFGGSSSYVEAAAGVATAGVPFGFGVAYSQGNSSGYILDGSVGYSVGSPIGGSASTYTKFGAASSVVSIPLFVRWDRRLSNAELLSFRENPWQIFRPQRRILYFDVVSSGGATGTISATWENFTSNITGTTTVVGTLSQTLSNFTSSIDGYPVTTGTIAQTLEDYTSTINGSPVNSGTITQTLEDHTSTISGSPVNSGNITQTLEDYISVISGSPVNSGALSQTLEDYTSSISGSIGSAISGTIAVTLENFTQSAQGTTTVVGTIAVNLNDFTSAITGTTTVIGTSNITLDPFIMTANGHTGDAALIRIRTLVGAGE